MEEKDLEVLGFVNEACWEIVPVLQPKLSVALERASLIVVGHEQDVDLL